MKLNNYIKKIISNAVKTICSITLLTLSYSANAQYCTSNPTSNAYEAISRVTLQGNTVKLDNITNTAPPGICETYNDYTTMTPVDLSAGGKYTLSVVSTTCTGLTFFTHRTLAWIDYNKSNTFEAAEAVVPTAITATSTPFTFNFTFTVPCNISTGNTRMRIVMIEGALTNPTNACGTYTWGETEDYTVNLQLPSSLSASFVAPSSAWVKSVVKFVNSNQTGYISHAWDADNNGTNEYNTINANHTWSTSGTKCMKLRSTNCLGSDSTVKCITINAPTVVPVANFVSDKVVVAQYESVKIFDLSTNGPWKWSWKIYDSTSGPGVQDIASGDVDPDPLSNGSNESSQNPEFFFNTPGCYTVELISTNDIGSSTPKVKKCYITVTLPTIYQLGFGIYGPNQDNSVESPSGSIFDNGGKNLNYSNNQGFGTRAFLKITPCNAKKITLNMTQLKFNSANDKLSVWDGKTPGGAGSTKLVTWSSTNTQPRSVVATSGSMYILFESDGTGVDSGFAGTYTSILGPATVATPAFTQSSAPAYNSVPTKFTNTTTDIVGIPTWEWTIDDVPVANTQNLNYVFTTDATYNVCLEIKSCVGNNKTCTSVDVVTPNTQTNLDFTSSNRRPKINLDLATLTPVSDKANRFEWTIYPTTYTLMNPPSNPSTYGTGFIKYNSTPGDSIPTPILKFTGTGCYTIALKAWNSIDPTNTTKTVVKNKFVCALDYCNPNAFITAADIGINAVKVSDNGVDLIDNNSISGISTYSDFTNTTSAALTFGKTYDLEVGRNTNVDPANRKAWIDWNIDGDFDDAGELIFTETSTKNKIYSTTFTVPNIGNAFEGTTRLRIAINFDSENTTPCGPLAAGEFHDYGIVLFNDDEKPLITLNGSSIKRIELGSSYADSGATAYDASEGDLTPEMIVTNDLDVNTTGIYTYEYNVTDNSGNQAAPVIRTIIVVNDLTPPVLTLNPSAPGCIEADRNNVAYTDPGATAYNTNPFYSLTSAIRTTGTVNTLQEGTYVLTYNVKDFNGNETSATRTVCVADTKAPVIKGTGATSIQIGSLFVDLTYAEDAYDDNPTLLKSWFPEPLNPAVKGTYTVTYTAKDQNNNTSAPVIVNYKVDDFVPPTISLNTFDEIEHDVNTPYVSVKATASDNYYNQVSISRISTTVNPNVLGKYTEVFKSVDGSNNVTLKTRTVNVVDKKAPTVWGGTIYGCVGEKIWPMWDLTTTDNYYGPDILVPMIEVVNQNVDPTNEGTYYITYKVTDPSGNVSAPLTRQVIYTYWPKCTNSTVSVNTINTNDNFIKLLPNPTTGLTKINFNSSVTLANVKVYNALGQVVLENNNSNTSEIDVDLTAFAKGIYSIKVSYDGNIVTKKLIVQ